ncbi:2,3-bisphosphoglycerate-independent phosphoglycerate mutase [Motiliproteus sp. MSK22-1]|uniref:2,3-bisphosphoglycerate-independent phosphoglycerate mutase n=1 Tax=Motiliproteus sp. MSK22-1 TaxID=1897630 RepID=UPI00097771F6|nr:2,3-bisphosphoglycerate-independent phosphoglycerate mutase [Motiliproteus sp. MSK22-1]OMH25830.1 phosphoglycerate mutase (2,3-diphosphoglycerate-independent) [Motiliproteus sp. MSK22-1]
MSNASGQTTNNKRPLALIILDGWGQSDSVEANAIYSARTPVWDHLISHYPHASIATSGNAVGLPEGQMGNSEVGHMNLGAGRTVYQNLTRIDKAIEDGSFFENPTLIEAIDKAVKTGNAVHIMGLLSPGGVHSHQHQIEAACEIAAKRGAKELYLHAFTDGRDTPPRSAASSIQSIDNKFKALGVGRIASIIGRYYAMDRDQRWERTSSAYQLLTQAQGSYQFDSAADALNAAYARDENDEFVSASIVKTPDQSSSAINTGDAVIFMNFRPDRARQLSRSFTDSSFSGFQTSLQPGDIHFVTLTQYADDITAPCAYPPIVLKNCLGDWLAKAGKSQLRLAETEKYAHVTFFFNGGVEKPFENEERILVPSPSVATYDLQPEMSAPEVTRHLVSAIENNHHDLIVCNYANGDMVGHTGNFDAAVKAVEALDHCLGQVIEAITSSGGQCLITADHGNVEQMLDPTSGQVHTAHTCEPVPLVYVSPFDTTALKDGALSDIAPTLLELMNLDIPAEMTGKPLVRVK